MRPLPSLVTMQTVPVSAMRKVAAADAHVGGEKFLAQSGARNAAHCLRIEGGRHVELFLENLGNILDALMDHRRHNMAGRFVGKLDDILAQIALHRLHAGFFQRVIEVNLFGRHGLGFDHFLHIVLACNIQHDRVGLGRSRAPNGPARHSPSRWPRIVPTDRASRAAHFLSSGGSGRASLAVDARPWPLHADYSGGRWSG